MISLAADIEWARLFQDYVSTLAWPLLAVFAIWIFRRNIARLIDRARNITSPFGSLTADEATQEPVIPPEEAGPLWSEGTPGGAQSHSEDQQPTDGEPRPRVLGDTAVSNFATLWFFEKTYRIIHGSQIQLLHAVQGVGETGLEKEGLEPFYDYYVNQFASLSALVGMPVRQSRQQYVGFLTSAGLIAETERAYLITELGQNFLIWLGLEIPAALVGTKPL